CVRGDQREIEARVARECVGGAREGWAPVVLIDQPRESGRRPDQLQRKDRFLETIRQPVEILRTRSAGREGGGRGCDRGDECAARRIHRQLSSTNTGGCSSKTPQLPRSANSPLRKLRTRARGRARFVSA